MAEEFARQINNNKNIVPFTYDRKQVKAGICHIGVGNFHRAHEEFYTNQLLEKFADQRNWGICGLQLLTFDEKLHRLLKSQDGMYTVTVCGRTGHDETHAIGSLVELIYGVEHPEEVFNKIASPDIKIITMTITEGGYNIDNLTGEFVLTEKNVAHDLKDPSHPVTAFGFVAEGLRHRIKAGAGPITILSCDNLQHNGNTCKKAFTTFFKAQDEELFKWVEKNVTFPNAMVDRITPSVTPADIERLNKKNGVEDKAPIYTEDFIQWVIEDNFIAGRPKWELVGAQFTKDVTPYENMKLSLLNASHSLLSYPSFYGGYRKVDAAMRDERIKKYVEEFMNIDITPYVPEPEGIDLNDYKKTLVERFANQTVSDQVARLCFDGAAKIPVYIMKNAESMVRDNKELKRIQFFFAMYRKYMRSTKDEKGVAYEVNDPKTTEDDWKLLRSDNALDALHISACRAFDFSAHENFTKGYLEYCKRLDSESMWTVLESVL